LSKINNPLRDNFFVKAFVNAIIWLILVFTSTARLEDE